MNNTRCLSAWSRCIITYLSPAVLLHHMLLLGFIPPNQFYLMWPPPQKSHFLISGFLCVCVCVYGQLASLCVSVYTMHHQATSLCAQIPVRSCGGPSSADSLTYRQDDESFPSGQPPPSRALHTWKQIHEKAYIQSTMWVKDVFLFYCRT